MVSIESSCNASIRMRQVVPSNISLRVLVESLTLGILDLTAWSLLEIDHLLDLQTLMCKICLTSTNLRPDMVSNDSFEDSRQYQFHIEIDRGTQLLDFLISPKDHSRMDKVPLNALWTTVLKIPLSFVILTYHTLSPKKIQTHILVTYCSYGELPKSIH